MRDGDDGTMHPEVKKTELADIDDDWVRAYPRSEHIKWKGKVFKVVDSHGRRREIVLRMVPEVKGKTYPEVKE